MLKERKSNPEDGGIVRRQLVVATDDKSKLSKDQSTFRLVKKLVFRLYAKLLFILLLPVVLFVFMWCIASGPLFSSRSL